MHVRTLDTITEDGNTDVALPTDTYKRHPEAVIQINITDTITIQVLGSLDGVTFVEVLAASAADQLAAVAFLPFYRFTATGQTDGTAVVKIGLNGPRE